MTKNPLESLFVRPGAWSADTQQMVADLLNPWMWIDHTTHKIRWRHVVPKQHLDEFWELARGAKAELLDLKDGQISDTRARELIELLKDDEP